jgi:thioredoxin-dependent peroxiredoxin
MCDSFLTDGVDFEGPGPASHVEPRTEVALPRCTAIHEEELVGNSKLVALVSVVLIAIAALAYAQGGAEKELKAGDQAPEFSLPGSDGKTHRLADLKGKTVVLAWFPKAFTGGWTAECKSLREGGSELRQFDVAYFAASVDDLETNTKFAQSLQADYPILSDADKKVATAYGVIGPFNVAKRWTFYIGPDGKILHVDREVKIPTAAQDIVARLRELNVPKAKGDWCRPALGAGR